MPPPPAVTDFLHFSTSLSTAAALSRSCEGQPAGYIPPLARADPSHRGAACCTVDGERWSWGSSKRAFTVQSISKVVSYGVALGRDRGGTLEAVGVEPSGMKFNELVLKTHRGGTGFVPHNPLINAGAIKVAELMFPDVEDASERFEAVVDVWTRLQGGVAPGFSNTVFLGEKATAFRNFALTYFMKERRAMAPRTDVDRVVSDYLSCCALESTCEDLAVLAATLANYGVNPLTKERVFDPLTTRDVLTVMASAGLYDASGGFMYRVGCPAKSGVAGGIILVVPGVAGLCAFSPRLDAQGNSVWAGEFFHNVFDMNPGLGLFSPLSTEFRPHHYVDSEDEAGSTSASEGEEEEEDVQGEAGHQHHRGAATRGMDVDSSRLVATTLFSAFRGDCTRIRQLVARGVNVCMAADYDARTALHVAVAGGHADMVALLLGLGANPHRKDRFGHSPVDDAVSGGARSEQIVQLLQEAAAASSTSSSPLDWSVELSRLQSFESTHGGLLTPTATKRRSTQFLTLAVPSPTELTKLLREEHGLSGIQESDVKDFEDLPPVVVRAMKGQLVIPSFSRFRSTMRELALESGACPLPQGSGAAAYSPVLAQAPREVFQVAVVSVDGQSLVHDEGAAAATAAATAAADVAGGLLLEVSLQSVFKPFAFALALEKFGLEHVAKFCDVEPSGKGFSHIALMESTGKAFNPLVNSGGLAMCALLLEHEDEFMGMWCRLTGQDAVRLREDVLEAERAHEDRHLATVLLMRERGTLPLLEQRGGLAYVQRVVDFYLRLCSVACTVEHVALAGSCLARFGVDARGTRVLDADVVRRVLRVMFSCGLAEESGAFMFNCGVPAKSGVSGLIMAVVPNVLGVAVLSPAVNESGNSVRGLDFCNRLAQRGRFHAFDRSPQTRVQFHMGLTADNLEELNLYRFIEAAARGDTWELRSLLSQGMAVSAQDYDGRTALHVAASERQDEAVALLLSAGADRGVRDRWGAVAVALGAGG